MKRFIYIFIIALQGSISFAQTPYDSFAPEISRPMLDLDFIRVRDAYHAQQVSSQDTILCFVDITDGKIIASVPLTDELRKWLSVDPLADKYPNISPYAYCGWNPIKFVDPDGRYFDETNEETAQKIEAEVYKKIKYAKKDNDRMRELCSTLIDIIDMRYDEDHQYCFESTRGKLASDKGITDDTPTTQYGGLNDKGIQVINMFSHLKKLDGTTAHEARHGGQIARGEIFYDDMGNVHNYGVRKEVDAYRAQWAWNGSLQAFVGEPFCTIPQIVTILQYNQINTDFVNSILEVKSFERIYPPKEVESELWNNH